MNDCTNEWHEVLRLNPESFEAATVPAFKWEFEGESLECRNCKDCRSTLVLAEELR